MSAVCVLPEDDRLLDGLPLPLPPTNDVELVLELDTLPEERTDPVGRAESFPLPLPPDDCRELSPEPGALPEGLTEPVDFVEGRLDADAVGLTLPVDAGNLELTPDPVPGAVPDAQSPGMVLVVSGTVVVIVDVSVTVD